MGCFEGKHASAVTESLPTTPPKVLSDTSLADFICGHCRLPNVVIASDVRAHLLLITLTGKQVPAFHQGDRTIPKHKI